MKKSDKKQKPAIVGNLLLAESFKKLSTKLKSAVKGMNEDGIKAINCTIRCGKIVLKDGRTAQITIRVNANKNDWI